MSEKRIDIHMLWKSGLLQIFSECGLNNVTTAKEYCRIYDHYIALRHEGKNYTVAVEITAEQLSVTERKVRRAVAFCV